MNGIEQLRAFISSGKPAGMAVSLAFQLVEVGDGFAAFEGVPGLHAYNPLGTVHGGYAATLLDSACGCAVHSKLAAGDGYTTLELKIAYHKAISEQTGKVRAEAPRAFSLRVGCKPDILKRQNQVSGRRLRRCGAYLSAPPAFPRKWPASRRRI